MELLKIVIQDEGGSRAPSSVAPPASSRPTSAPEAAPLRPGERRNADLDAAFGVKPTAAPATHAPEAAPAHEPTPAVPVNSGDEWYQRYRELQGRFDQYQAESQKLSAVELAELERLRAKLQEQRSAPEATPGTAKPSPVPEAPLPRPEATPGNKPSPLADDNWYQRFHELQNRFDLYAGTSKRLSDAELQELERLRQRLHEESNKPPPKATPASPGSGTTPQPTEPPKPRSSGSTPDVPEPPKPQAPTPTPAAPSAGSSAPGGKPPSAPPGPPPKPPTLEDAFYGPATPRPRTPKIEDFGFRPTATPVPPKPPLPVANPAGTQAIKDLIPPKIGTALDAFGVDTAGMAAGAARAAPALAGMAAAAGPAAIALLVVDQATKAIVGGLGKMERAVDATGKGLAQLASNDNAGAAATAFEAVTGAMDEAGPALKILSAEIKLAVAPVRAMAAVSAAFVERGKLLAGFNSDIGAAQARAAARSTIADAKEAQVLGEKLSKLTDNQSQIETNIRDLVLPIKEVLVSLLAEVSEVGKEGTALLKEFAPVIRFFVQVLAVVPMTELKLLGTILRMLHDVLKYFLEQFGLKTKEESEDVLNSMLRGFLGAADRIPAMPAGGRPGQRGAGGGPIMGGI